MASFFQGASTHRCRSSPGPPAAKATWRAATPLSASCSPRMLRSPSPRNRCASGFDMARENKNLIVALDVGTSKVVAMVAELFPDGRLDIIGMGGHESKGLKKGVVVNIEATVNAIQRTLEEAELMADCKIERVF